jgi:hypothetical protein
LQRDWVRIVEMSPYITLLHIMYVLSLRQILTSVLQACNYVLLTRHWSLNFD